MGVFMRRLFLSVFCFFGKMILSLRYNIKVQGKDVLKAPQLKKGGILFLPNHPALLDRSNGYASPQMGNN